MMKRWISAFMAMFMVLSMCAPVAWASPIQVIVYKAPTNLRWDDSYKMHWDWTNTASEYPFEGFQVILYYSATDIPTTSMEGWQQKGHRSFWESGLPSLGDFSVTQPGYYAFQVYAYGYGEQTDENGDTWFYEYVSPVSVMSPSRYFAANAKPLDEPTELRWEGGTLTWDYGDISGLSFFEIQTEYFEPGANSSSAGTKYTIPTDQKSFTLNSHVLRMGAGTYYVNVRALSANFAVATDSDWVRSDGLVWDGPAGKLATPTDLAWEGRTMTWTGPEKHVENYQVEIFYSNTSTLELPTMPETGSMSESEYAEALEEYYRIYNEHSLGIYIVNECSFTLNNYLVKDTPGHYFFRVQASTNSALDAADSEWSVLSAPSDYINGPTTLPVPTAPAWNGTQMSWDWTATGEQQEYLRNFQVWLWYAETEADLDDPTSCGWFFASNAAAASNAWKKRAKGDGLYLFQVAARSNDTELYNDSIFGEKSEPMEYNAPDPLLPPTDLAWNGSVVSWKPSASDPALVGDSYVYLFFRPQGGTSDEQIASWSVPPSDRVVFVGSDLFKSHGAGRYTFEVQTESTDPDLAIGSDYIESEFFEYIPTDTVLDAPDGLKWNDATAQWDVDSTVSFYEVQYFSVEYPDRYSSHLVTAGKYVPMPEWVMYDFGPEIGFRVRAISDDLNAANDGAWATCQTYYTLPGLAAPTEPLWNETDRTLSWTWTPADEQQNALLNSFMVNLYYSATQNGTPEKVDSLWADRQEFFLEFNRWARSAEQAGWYSFTVQADTSDYTVMDGSPESAMSEAIYYEPAPKLAAPSNPRWNGSVCTWDASPDEDTRAFSEYEIQLIYRRNNDQDYQTMSLGYTYDSNSYAFASSAFKNIGSGQFSFRVRATSYEPAMNSNSQWVTCDTWFTYTGASAAKLAPPTGLHWDKTTAKWNANTDGSVAFYQVRFFNAGSPDNWSSQGTVPAGDFLSLSQWVMEEMSRDVHFMVKAISANVNNYQDSDWVSYTADTYTLADPLGTPTELTWGRDYFYDGTYELIPGFISWKRPVDENGALLDQARYYIKIYNVNDPTEPVISGSRSYDSTNREAYFSVDNLLRQDDLPSGTYYFTVQARGDNINYSNGPIATSDPWTYVNPGKKLPILTNLRWDGRTLMWDAPDDLTNVRGAHIEYYFSDTKAGEQTHIGSTWYSRFYTSDSLDDDTLMENGNGYYWCKVRLLSNDITAVTPSEYVAVSEPYFQGEISDKVNAELSEVLGTLDKTSTPEQVQEVVDTVKAMDTEELASAMAADQTGAEDGTLDKIAQLEEMTGVTSDTAVSTEMEDTFDASKVSVVGAALNAGEGTEKVELSISKADEGTVIPTQYNNSVQFSMKLTDENGNNTTLDTDNDPTNGQQLAIPVRITLPVPEGVNPAFLVVLHFKSNGEHEELRHSHLYREGGQWYVSFIVTSFSDFALASTMQARSSVHGTQVEVQVTTSALQGQKSAFCALYDENGRQLDIVALKLTSGTQTVYLDCEAFAAHTVKLFLLGDGSTPLIEAAECEVK